jgi:hypothetical protein
MKVDGYLNIKSNGTIRFTKSKIGLGLDEISMKISFDIPNELFKRPLLQANVFISKDIIPKSQPIDINIIN